MKKTVLTLTVAFLVALLAYGVSTPTAEAAKVSGPCADCHTMHNSQNGVPMNLDASATPNNNLTRSNCVGCHTNAAYSAKGVVLNDATKPTAAGTFAAATASTDAKRHNVSGLFAIDATLDGKVPGNTGSAIIFAAGQPVTCDGPKGCHGTHDATGGVNGYHHGSKQGYRFLYAPPAGSINAAYDVQYKVAGKGSTVRELNGASATDHNVYKSLAGNASDTGVAGNDATGKSVSQLCALCHGGFHGTANTNAASPFVRHPTENLIPAGWSGVTVDYTNNPFAFDDISALTTGAAYTATNAKVACISCHRAHGSANDDLLRFNYTLQVAGGGGTTGCLGCHVNQR